MNGTKYLNITLTVDVRCRLSADLFPDVYLTQDWRCWTFKLSLLQTGTYYRAARRQSGGGSCFNSVLSFLYTLHLTSQTAKQSSIKSISKVRPFTELVKLAPLIRSLLPNFHRWSKTKFGIDFYLCHFWGSLQGFESKHRKPEIGIGWCSVGSEIVKIHFWSNAKWRTASKLLDIKPQ